MKRILVTGSREFDNISLVENSIIDLQDEVYIDWHDTTIVHGDCPSGADRWADDFANSVNLKVERYPADWAKYGKRAAYLRNQAMVDSLVPDRDIVLAFKQRGSANRGTQMTIDLARKAGLEIREYWND